MEESKTSRSYYARIIEFPDLACNAHLFPGRMLNLINSESQQTATHVGPISRSGMFQFLTGSALFVVTLAIIFFGLIRYRLRDMPLERDEGEYAYSGQLLLQGIPPYKLAYNMKLPGIYAAYTGILAVFGESPAGIHLGLLLVNAASILILYFLTALQFGRLAAAVAACSYALLSTSSSVMGFEAHATNFVVLPAMLGILFLLLALRSKRTSLFFLGGLCSGMAILMKQHGLSFAAFCFLYLLWIHRKQRAHSATVIRHAGVFVFGAILPYAATCLWLYHAGVFQQFWFWTVSYAGEYSKIGMHRAARNFLENSRTVIAPALLFWILAAVGLTASLWNRGARQHAFFLVTLLIFSFLSLCPGAFFRPHYFILMLPITAILVGVAVNAASEGLAAHTTRRLSLIPMFVFLAAFAYSVFVQRRDYFFNTPLQVFESTYSASAFVPALEVAEHIRRESPEAAHIAVLGSEPEIYFYAHRHSATGFLYMYSLIGRQKYTALMREDMMRELQANHPDYVVYVDVWDSWGERAGVPQAAGFLAWLQDFMKSSYERVGVADIGEQTRYVWGDAAKTYMAQSSKVIYVLKRRELLP